MSKIEKLQKELKKLEIKRDKIVASQMNSYRNGSASRARTTTTNARLGWLAEDIRSIKDQIDAENLIDKCD